MKNFKARIAPLIGIIALVAVIGFSMTGCKTDDDGGPSYNNDPGEFAGTWKGTNSYNQPFTVTISSSGWTISVPTQNYSDSGNFNRDGNTAQLYSNTSGHVGTSTVVDANTIRVVLNQNSADPGTHIMTRQQ